MPCSKRVTSGRMPEHKPPFSLLQEPLSPSRLQQRQRERGIFTSLSEEAVTAQSGQEAAACPDEACLAEVSRMAAGGHLRRGVCQCSDRQQPILS